MLNLFSQLKPYNLLARQVEVPQAIQVFVVVSLVCRALLFPFFLGFYTSALGLILFQITTNHSEFSV